MLNVVSDGIAGPLVGGLMITDEIMLVLAGISPIAVLNQCMLVMVTEIAPLTNTVTGASGDLQAVC